MLRSASPLGISTRKGASNARSSPRRGCMVHPCVTATRRRSFERQQEPHHAPKGLQGPPTRGLGSNKGQ
eukprot:2922335-Alexandrium_andersonii.AAC.1